TSANGAAAEVESLNSDHDNGAGINPHGVINSIGRGLEFGSGNFHLREPAVFCLIPLPNSLNCTRRGLRSHNVRRMQMADVANLALGVACITLDNDLANCSPRAGNDIKK